MGNTCKSLMVLLTLVCSLAVGTAGAQARSDYRPSVKVTHSRVTCMTEHLGAGLYCRAVMHRHAIKIVRQKIVVEMHRTHVRLHVSHHLGWKVAALWRANRWERHRLRHLQSLPTWEPSQPVPLGHLLAAEAGWTEANGQWSCLYALWNRESGWTTPDTNSSSGAAGIPQALPPSKMGPGWDETSGGRPTLRALKIQIRWGIGYIKARYGDACSALANSNAYNYY